MNLRFLIDGIVRQTTVLLAQLSTTAGSRAPLAHIADQVFLQLATELEAQGVKRAVAADMFGMALRTYQKKLQRVTESVSDPGRTLWEAVYETIRSESPTRRRLEERFRNDGEREVGSVLHDLVNNGLVSVTGQGAHALYLATSEKVQGQISASYNQEALASLIWLRVAHGESDVELLREAIGVPVEQFQSALQGLEASGQVYREDSALKAKRLFIPPGSASGAETAMLDHYRAVCKLLASRCTSLLSGTAEAARTTESGGSTFRLSVYPGHPFELQVNALFARMRSETQKLWEEVSTYNEQHRVPEKCEPVTFYLGQVKDVAGDE